MMSSVILLSMLLILLKCDEASDLWQQLELAAEFKSNLQHTLHWGRKWLVYFNAGKIQLGSFDQFNNTGATELMGLFLKKNHLSEEQLRDWAK